MLVALAIRLADHLKSKEFASQWSPDVERLTVGEAAATEEG
jgi:hypothetical protein